MEKTTIEELQAEIESLKKEVRTLKDIEAIKVLQKSYGYYLEHMMSQEVIDLFSDGPDEKKGSGGFSAPSKLPRSSFIR